MTEATRPPTVRRVLATEARRLEECSPSPRLDVEILLAYVLGCTRERLYAVPERVLSPPSVRACASSWRDVPATSRSPT